MTTPPITPALITDFRPDPDGAATFDELHRESGHTEPAVDDDGADAGDGA